MNAISEQTFRNQFNIPEGIPIYEEPSNDASQRRFVLLHPIRIVIQVNRASTPDRVFDAPPAPAEEKKEEKSG